MDGGAFVTMPQVFSLPPGSRNVVESNLANLPRQFNGDDITTKMAFVLIAPRYHHTLYNESKEIFAVRFLWAVHLRMHFRRSCLCQRLSELTFAGMLAGRRFRYAWRDGYVLSGDADFVITGTVRKEKTRRPFWRSPGLLQSHPRFPGDGRAQSLPPQGCALAFQRGR